MPVSAWLFHAGKTGRARCCLLLLLLLLLLLPLSLLLLPPCSPPGSAPSHLEVAFQHAEPSLAPAQRQPHLQQGSGIEVQIQGQGRLKDKPFAVSQAIHSHVATGEQLARAGGCALAAAHSCPCLTSSTSISASASSRHSTPWLHPRCRIKICKARKARQARGTPVKKEREHCCASWAS